MGMASANHRARGVSPSSECTLVVLYCLTRSAKWSTKTARQFQAFHRAPDAPDLGGQGPWLGSGATTGLFEHAEQGIKLQGRQLVQVEVHRTPAKVVREHSLAAQQVLLRPNIGT